MKAQLNHKSNNYSLPMVSGSTHHMYVVDGLMPATSVDPVSPVQGRRIHFVEHITALIEAHMDEETYGIEDLCRDAGASRTQIHHKLKKWTGLSTSHFIRSIKLQRAKYLLVQTDLNITQVAFAVGFQDPSYFTRVFNDSFHISPKKFRNTWQQA